MLTSAPPLARFACTTLSAASALVLAVPAGVLPARVLVVAMCHGGPVSIPIGDERPEPNKQCPGACHAACTRKRADDEGAE